MPDPENDPYLVPLPVPPRARGATNYDPIIQRHAARTGLDPLLVRAVIGQESSGNPNAVSPKGARGLMQLMPATAKRFHVTDIHDPEQNIRGGTDYLKFLSDKFNGDTSLILAGYNAGEGAVEKYGNKVPPYRETRDYVKKISANYARAQNQDPYLVPVNGQEVAQEERDPYLVDVTQPEPVQPPITSALDKLTREVNRRTARVQKSQPAQLSYADLKRNEYPQDLSLAQLKQREEVRQTTPSNNPRGIDLRILKGEQPANRLAYMRGTGNAPASSPQGQAESRLATMQARDAQQAQAQQAEWQQQNVQAIADQTAEYRADIQKAKAKGGDANKWLAEMGSKGAAGLTELVGGVVKPFSPELSNKLRVHVEAAQRAAIEEGADRNWASKMAQDVVGGFISSAPELAAMGAGVPAPLVFGAGSGTRAYAGGRPVVPAVVHGAATGAAFEMPTVGQGAAKILSRAGGVGAASTGVELASGASPREAIASGLTNAAMAAVPEVPEVLTRGRGNEPNRRISGTASRGTESTPTEVDAERTKAAVVAIPDRTTTAAAEFRGTDIPEPVPNEVAPNIGRSSEVAPHHANFQPRRVRNTEHGNKGQFKSGKPEVPVPAEQSAQIPLESKSVEGVERSAPSPQVASVPFMITRKMEADLKGRGYSQGDIDKLTPQQANDILSASEVPKSELKGEPQDALTKPQSLEQGNENLDRQISSTGAGGANSPQGETPAPDKSITSARKEMFKTDRAELDLPELPSPERKAWQTTLDNAKEKKIDQRASLIADEVLTRHRALNDEETAGLVLRAQEIKNEHGRVMKEIGATNDPNLIEAKRSEADALQREFDKITEATKKSGTEKGRALASQKLTINQDYDLVSVLQRVKAAKGRELTPEERTKFEGMTKQIEDLQAKLAKAEADALQRTIQKDIERIRKQTKRVETRKALDDEFADLRAQFAQARMETKGVQAAGLAGFDPEGKLTPIILKMARNRVKAGVVEASAVVDHVYNAVKEHIEDLKREDIANLLAQHNLERDPLPAIKTRLAKQEKELTRRIAEKDYTPAPPRKPVTDDREASNLKARVEQLKRKIDADTRGLDSKLDVILAMRKAGMLTGIRTHARNIGGTGAFQAFEEVSRVPGALADLLVSTVTKQRALGAPNPVAVAKSSYEAATKGVNEALQIVKYGATAEDLAKLERPREMNSGSRILDAYVNTVFRTLGAEDKIFRTYAFKRSIEDQARLRTKEFKQTTKELIDTPPAEMVAQATLDAEVATFNNQNKAAKGVEWLRRQSGPVGSTAIDLVLPFKQTPANIASRLMESTPLGLGRGAGQLIKAAINKKMTFADQRKFSQTIGRSVTGSGLIALGYWMAQNGLATGLAEDNAGDREVQKASGRSPLSIRIGNAWHQIGAFSPIGNLIAIGAALHREQNRPLKEGEERGSLVSAAVPVGAKVLMDQPFLRGASGVVDALENPSRAGSAFAGQTLGSFIPTIVSDTGATIDNKRREVRGITAAVQNRIPIARSRLPEDIDVFGRPLQSRRTAMVDPTLTSTAKDEPFLKELVRLDVGVPKTHRLPADTDEQYRKRLELQGKAIADDLSKVVETRSYQAMSDEDKTKAIKDAIEKVRKSVNDWIPTGGKGRERPQRQSRPVRGNYVYRP